MQKLLWWISLFLGVICGGAVYAEAQSEVRCETLPQYWSILARSHVTALPELNSFSQPDRRSEKVLNTLFETLDPNHSLFTAAELSRFATGRVRRDLGALLFEAPSNGSVSAVVDTRRAGPAPWDRCRSLVGIRQIHQTALRRRQEVTRSCLRRIPRMSLARQLDQLLVRGFVMGVPQVVLAQRASWARADEELCQRLKVEMTLDYSDQIGAEQRPEDAVEFALRRLEATTAGRPETEVSTLLARALARSLDPFSRYLSERETTQMDRQYRSARPGVGLEVQPVLGGLYVKRVLPGSPAEADGRIHAGDVIQPASDFVAGLFSSHPDPVDVTDWLAGEYGDPVQIRVVKAGDERRDETYAVPTGSIRPSVNTVAVSIVESQGVKLGVIEFPFFFNPEFEEAPGGIGPRRVRSPGVADVVRAEVERLIRDRSYGREGIQGLVLDFRRNHGGSLDEALKLLGRFLDGGAVLLTQSPISSVRRIEEVFTDSAPGTIFSGPLTVLISPHTASAAEIVAGGLQAYNRALIVGSRKSFGKGSMQSLLRSTTVNLGVPGSALLTTAYFYLPNGQPIEGQGVGADIILNADDGAALDGNHHDLIPGALPTPQPVASRLGGLWQTDDQKSALIQSLQDRAAPVAETAADADLQMRQATLLLSEWVRQTAPRTAQAGGRQQTASLNVKGQ